MKKDCILIVGALGQIGAELTIALRDIYGSQYVIASDIVEERQLRGNVGIYEHLNILDRERLHTIVNKYKVTQIYLMAAILSAKGERNPNFAWRLNMEGLFNVLNLAVEKNLDKVFWPSSIAIFGPTTPKENTPQNTITDPTTAYGISKLAGERWAEYYYANKGVDIRSIRYPGLISYKAEPGGGTTDYAVEIFHEAVNRGFYTCFLKEDTRLPMMYMPDAIRATLELMHAPVEQVKVRSSYNLEGINFTPEELANAIKKIMPDFVINYEPDFRQKIADNWPKSIDDSSAEADWGWKSEYGITDMTEEMLRHLRQRYLQDNI